MRRDPYAALGLDPSASVADAEACFRQLLKQHHPDHHVGASPEEVAEAERRTRELTDAIAAIRAGWERDLGFEAGAGTDWFGHPTSDDRSPVGVDCPFCGLPFWHLDDFDVHLRAAHPVRHPRMRPRRSRAEAVGQWVRYLPAPSLSLFFLLLLYWKALFGLAPSEVQLPGFWIGVFGFLLLLTLAQLARRRRYQSQRWRLD
jgi:hypothetical protein